MSNVLLVIAIMAYALFAAQGLYQWIQRKRRGALPEPHTYRVVLHGMHGGWVYFLENGKCCAFGTEALAGPSAMFVYAARAGWDEAYPWAAGRREEVLTLVGAELTNGKQLTYEISDAGLELKGAL